MSSKTPLRIAMPAWEIGRVGTGLGAKVGGLAVVVEELPQALLNAAAKQGIDLEIELLTPCFAHYDKSKLTKLAVTMPVTLDEHTFSFEVYKHTFPDGVTAVYFWDEWQLGWTNSSAIYPHDLNMAMYLFAAVSQAMAGYIRQGSFDTIHSHDYHVGLIPFYLGDDYLAQVPHHFTIHNASYQGIYAAHQRGYEVLASLNLSGAGLFHKYFDFFDNLNFMKASMIKIHETGGKITTVSGDLTASWGYAAELRESGESVYQRAMAQKGGQPAGEVFVPNRHLDIFEQLPIIGITNGMSPGNRPENLPQLKASVLQSIQAQQPEGQPLFQHPFVQAAMLTEDHNFDVEHTAVKADLKRLLHLEAFGTEPMYDPILITVVGRLVAQKNLSLIGDIIERTLAYDAGVKFIMLASASSGDSEGQATESHFFWLASQHPHCVYFNNSFNLPLSKLILAGGDFNLIPSRFEPCGLVDYEASLLGNIVIGRRTGGLPKVAHCAYLYDWLDISDRLGEAATFFEQIKAAIDTYRHAPAHHHHLLKTAMAVDAAWDQSAAQYIQMYRYGLLMKRWRIEREQIQQRVDQFIQAVHTEDDLFGDFYQPLWGDGLDWFLKERLMSKVAR